jgi:hypothetical protein
MYIAEEMQEAAQLGRFFLGQRIRPQRSGEIPRRADQVGGEI